MHRKIVISLATVGLFLLVLWLTSSHRIHEIQNPLKIPRVGQSKISEISNAAMEIAFTCPDAIQTVLVLGYSNQVPVTAFANGKITVSNKNGKFELLLNQDTVTPCNWLERYSLNGFLLSDPNSGAWNWKNTIISGSRNSLIITNIPTGGSIWLFHTHPSGWDLPWVHKPSKHSQNNQ
jgi:hypothetical protein